MEAQFYEQFTKFTKSKKKISITPKRKYEEVVSTIQKCTESKPEKLSQSESNILRRYSLRIEDMVPVLYYQGDTAKEKPQRVVKQEELFNLLKNTHIRVEVGKTVNLPIDDVDRPKLGLSNIFGVVLAVEEGFYKIGTKSGILPQLFTRNQFEPCENSFLSADEVPQQETSFRSAVGGDSLFGKQGHKHCMCTTGCKKNSCSCRRQNMLCNSRCHYSNSCQNK